MMVPGERKQQILALLERKRYVTVEELSTELFVSLPTVRRDLAALEQEGALTRTHGGASYNQAGTQVAPFILREKNNYEEYEDADGMKYLVIFNDYESTYIWDNGRYIFEIGSNLDKSDILKLCKSTKVK